LIVGVAGKPVDTQANFYRAVWGQGDAGADISLNLVQGVESRTVVIRSGDRGSYFNAQPARAVPHDSQRTRAVPRFFRTGWLGKIGALL
jgi:hypothetical protein